MSFGGSNRARGQKQGLPPQPAFAARMADASVLLSGLMGLRPNRNPALSTSFNSGSAGGLGRRPSLSKRTVMGGV